MTLTLFAHIIFAWLAINGAIFVLLPFEESVRLSRNIINRFKRAIGAR